MANYLDGKVAIVTGSGRGIGAGVAKQLASEGAKVIVNDIGAALDGEGSSNTPAEQVVEEIKAAGGEATPNYTDISTMEGGEAIVKSALDNYDKLDIVVTVAGILRDRMIFNMTEQEWDDVIRVHLKGTFTVCKYASILYRQQRSGRIITFASESGLIGNTGQGNYAAAKSGIIGMSKSLALEYAKKNITINCVSPGFIVSDMTMNIAEKVRLYLTSRIPMGKLGTGEDVSNCVAFLSSDQASYITGETLHVNGGMYMA